MSARLSIAVIDDHPLVRAGIIKTLGLDRHIKVVGEGSTADEAVRIAQTVHPDILLLDISIPGNGINAARQISGMSNAPKIVMLTVSEDDDTVLSAIEAGAVGYITKGVESPDLIAAIQSIAAGRSFVSPNLTHRLIAKMKVDSVPSLSSTLTHQERRTIALVAKGFTNREIGEQLGLVENSVKAHMTKIMAKIKVRNRVEAANWAQKHILD